MRRTVLLLGLLGGCDAVAAGERFASDFEGPTLLTTDTPPGVWDAVDLRPNGTHTLSTAAANRGIKGLRLDDQIIGTGPGNGTAIYATIPGAAVSVAQMRVRFRLSSTNQLGQVVVAQALTTMGKSLCEISLSFPGALVTLAGDSSGGSFTTVDSGVRLSLLRNVLLECTVRGIGTDAGMRTLHIDSVDVASELVDLSGWRLAEVGIGEPWSEDRRFVGQLDFDDFRVANQMQAARLVLDAGLAILDEGQCTAVQVSIADSQGVASGLPYPAMVSSSVMNAELFSDPACSASLATIPFAVEQTAQMVFLKAGSASQAALDLQFADLVATGVVLPIRRVDAGIDSGVTDAGAPDAGVARPAYQIGCGCESGPGVPVPLVLFVLAIIRARRKTGAGRQGAGSARFS